jgi:dipeptidyl aminopeptidase/acylaminoacyl peptidase
MLGLIDRDNVRCIISFAPVTDPVELVALGGFSGLFWERYIGARADVRANPAAISPARRAGEFAAPILLMHGAEDSVVPIAESRHLVRNLRNPDRLRYIEMPAIDHYLTTADSRRQLLSESAALLREHLPVE